MALIWKKKAIFDLLFTFSSHQGKVTKNPSAHISNTYIHIFCSPYWLFCLTNFENNTYLSGFANTVFLKFKWQWYHTTVKSETKAIIPAMFTIINYKFVVENYCTHSSSDFISCSSLFPKICSSIVKVHFLSYYADRWGGGWERS